MRGEQTEPLDCGCNYGDWTHCCDCIVGMGEEIDALTTELNEVVGQLVAVYRDMQRIYGVTPPLMRGSVKVLWDSTAHMWEPHPT